MIWKEIAFVTRRCSSAGDPTRSQRLAATISSKSRPLTSWRRCSGPELLGDVLQVDPNPIPRRGTAAHLIHQHIGRLQVLCHAGMLLLPFRQSCERFLLILAAADLDQRKFLRPRARLGWLYARRLAGLLAVVRRPRRIALPFLLLARG